MNSQLLSVVIVYFLNLIFNLKNVLYQYVLALDSCAFVIVFEWDSQFKCNNITSLHVVNQT